MPGGQYINHFAAVRMRVTGTGNLKTKLISMDTVTEKQLADTTLLPTNSRYPNKLVNFKAQKAQLELRLTQLDETFLLRQILIYKKPVASSFPQ